MRRVRIGDRLVGDGEPAFIVAEVGVNHNGDISLARRLVDAARDSGVDAVKFQAFSADKIVTKYAEKAKYQKETTEKNESQYEMLKKLELSEKEFGELFDYTCGSGLVFLASAFDRKNVSMLDDLGVPAFKVASGEITNFPLLETIAEKRKPVILSTGMSTLGEIEEALEVLKQKGSENVVLLHCVTSYPARIEDVNLKAIGMLKHAFKVPVGYSDHTLGITIPVGAVALGAVMLEKHFTLDRNLPGPDHKASSDPREMKEMVRAIRSLEKALGNGIKRPTESEEKIMQFVRRSIVARMGIQKGDIITEDMLDVRRPATGIRPKHINAIVGRRARKQILKEEIIDWEMIE